MHWITWILIVTLLPYFLFLAAILYAATKTQRGNQSSPLLRSDMSPPFMVFLVPAHDEEVGIEATVRGLLAHDYPRECFTVVVVADNCQDQTAQVAWAAGASVLERSDATRRGKGYALEYAIKKLESGELPWDAVVVIDADSTVDPGFLWNFAANLENGMDWQQAYDTVSNAEASWRTKLMTLALSLFNGTWLLGLMGLGLGSPLRGNGMALSRRGLSRHPLKAYGLAEDLEFSWRLRLAGERVHFEPRATVRAFMLSGGGAGARNQRLRWEHGRSVLRREFIREIWKCPGWTFFKRVAASLDLYFPPLSRLGCGLLASMIGAVIFDIPAAQTIVGVYCVILGTYILSPIVLLNLPARYLVAVVNAPRYVLWKVLLAFTPKPRAWIRTARE